MKRSYTWDNAAIGIYLVYIFGVFALLVGWIMNLFAIVHLLVSNAPFTTLFIGRIVGAFLLPLGGILGYF